MQWWWNNNSRYIPIFESHLSFLLRQMLKREKKLKFAMTIEQIVSLLFKWSTNLITDTEKEIEKRKKKKNNEFLSNFTCIVHKIKILSSPYKQKRTRLKIKTKRCAVMWNSQVEFFIHNRFGGNYMYIYFIEFHQSELQI